MHEGGWQRGLRVPIPVHRGWHRDPHAEQKLRWMPWDGAPGQAGVGRGETPMLTPSSVPLAGDESSDLVRHFLIESSAKGVHLKGASEELYFGKDGAVTRSPGNPKSGPRSPSEQRPCLQRGCWHGGPPAPGSCPPFSARQAVVAASKARTWGGGWKTHFCCCEVPNGPA